MTVGKLVAFNAYLAYLAWPTLALGWVLSLWQRGLAGWSRIVSILEIPVETVPETAAHRPLKPHLEARQLRVEREGRTVLQNVSFCLEPGQTLAIVGGTGGGKSTLCDAILRLCEVGPGQLFVDGVDVLDLNLGDLRRLTAYAPQDAFLFSATIDENIAFGARQADPSPETRNARLRAAESAGLSRDLKEFPAGIDTVVGERGITLSGGQRQRVALARALAAEGQLLILDDALSSVDAETERSILLNLIPIMKNRSTIIVSHRVAAVAHADEILVLEGGLVVERGKHADLSRADGPYARLYREQLQQAPGAIAGVA
jgi:ATP-binding cassette subfamily B protein